MVFTTSQNIFGGALNDTGMKCRPPKNLRFHYITSYITSKVALIGLNVIFRVNVLTPETFKSCIQCACSKYEFQMSSCVASLA